MAMAAKAISGFGGSVSVGGSAVEVVEWNATINSENFDSTHLGSSGYRERQFLIQDVTGSFSAHEAILPNTSVSTLVLTLGSSGSGLASITGKIRHSMGVNNPQDKVTFDHDFESTGPFTVA
jgi:hypothetical protein